MTPCELTNICRNLKEWIILRQGWFKGIDDAVANIAPRFISGKLIIIKDGQIFYR